MLGHRVDDERQLVSLMLQKGISDRLRYAIQGTFGIQNDARVIVNMVPMTIAFDTAKWYGVTQYLIYELNQNWSAGARVEWFRDQDHSRIAVPIQFNPGGPTFLGSDYAAISFGLNWKPIDRVWLRPELRWDVSNFRGNGAVPGGDPNMRAYVDGHHRQQLTLATDLIVTF